MPAPTDRQGLRRILGMVNYLANFLPRLSDVSTPLRQLDKKGTEWKWTRDHGKAWTEIQMLVATATTLAYFDQAKEITFQCDASQNGLGVAMMQVGLLRFESTYSCGKKLRSDRKTATYY